MSKLETTLHFLGNLKKAIPVILEKYPNPICTLFKEDLAKMRQKAKVKVAGRVDRGRQGMPDEEFFCRFGRLSQAQYSALLFSPLLGKAGTLATTNYYSNWVSGLRLNNIDAIWAAEKMDEKPQIDIGFIDGPILKAPYKNEQFDVQNIINIEKPHFVLCHNCIESINFMETTNLNGALKFMFVGDSMTQRIQDPILRRRHIERIIGSADGLIVVSRFLKESWIEYGFDADKIFITKTPVDAKSWPEYSGSGEQSQAAYFGNIYHKEIDNILEIAPLVLKEIPSFIVNVFGDGMSDDCAKLQERIKEHNLEDCVKLWVSVPLHEMQKVQSKMDVLILPREKAEFSTAGFPNKIGEYLASGCPSVITNTGEINKVISDGEHAYIVEANDNRKFAEAVIRSLKNHNRSVEIAQAGKKRIEAHSAPEKVVSEFLEWMGKTYEK